MLLAVPCENLNSEQGAVRNFNNTHVTDSTNLYTNIETIDLLYNFVTLSTATVPLCTEYRDF